ncbi:hypothetical protein BKA93DRAFT_754251 [Sparassis latifolia]
MNYQSLVKLTIGTLDYEGLIRAVNGLNSREENFLVQSLPENRASYVIFVIFNEVMEMMWEMIDYGRPRAPQSGVGWDMIPELRDVLFSMNDTISDFKLDHYYRPSGQNNTMFNLLMCMQENDQNYVTVFQLTLAKRHHIQEEGLKFLEEAFHLPNGMASILSPHIHCFLVMQSDEQATCMFPKEWDDKWQSILNVYALEIDL